MKTAVIPATISITPVRRRTPVPTSPGPMVVAPSPSSSHPNVSRCRASWHNLNHRARHGRRHHNRSWSYHDRCRRYHHRGWNRDSETDTEMNPGVYSGDSKSGQGQNCNCLFHIYWMDASGRQSLVINRQPFCNRLEGPKETGTCRLGNRCEPEPDAIPNRSVLLLRVQEDFSDVLRSGVHAPAILVGECLAIRRPA